MKCRKIGALGYLLVALTASWCGYGCRSRMVYPRVDVDVSKLPPDVYVETEPATGAVEAITTQDEAIRRALERHPDIVALREAARVAWAQARTISGLRDPEFGLGFGRGDRITERSWLVPRAELMPTLVYPYRGTFVTSHPEDLGLSTDPRVPRIVIPEGGEEAYLERSPRTFRGTTSDSDMFRTSIRFYPPNPFTITARGAVNRANYAAVVCDLYSLEWQVRCRVRWLLARLQFLEQDIAHQTEVVALRKRVADATEALAQQGQMIALDAVAASQQYLKAVAERDQALAERATLRRELERLVGGAVEVPARYTEAPTNVTAEAFSQADWRRLVVERRRDIGAAYWRAQLAEAALWEARMSRVPWFTQVEGSMSRSRRRDRLEPAWELQRGTAELDPLYSISLDETEESEWRVEAMVTIPFFSLGPGATRVQAAQRQRAWAVLAGATRAALDNVRDSIIAWGEAENRLGQTQQLLAPYLEQARSVLESLRSGEGLAGYDQDRLRLAVLDMLRLAASREFEVAEAQWRVEQTLGVPLEEAVPLLAPEAAVESNQPTGKAAPSIESPKSTEQAAGERRVKKTGRQRRPPRTNKPSLRRMPKGR
jgi:outer membrane protein TolC